MGMKLGDRARRDLIYIYILCVSGLIYEINALRLLIGVELEKMLSNGEKDDQDSKMNTQRDCVL